MQKVGIGIALGILVGFALVYLFESEGLQVRQKFIDVRNELERTSSELTSLREKVEELDASHEELARVARSAQPPELGERKEGPPAPPGDQAPPSGGFDINSPQLRDHVFSLIDEKYRLDEEARRREIEDRRREREEFGKGPYGQFNLKVNSLAAVLDLDEAQKDRYYELTKKCWNELQELRKTADWRSEGGRTQYREAQEKIQKEYGQAVEALLMPEQLQSYQQIPSWARGVQALGQVPSPGEETRPFTRLRDSVEAMRGLRRDRERRAAEPKE